MKPKRRGGEAWDLAGTLADLEGEERFRFVFQHPFLLEQRTLDALREDLASASKEEAGGRAGVLQGLTNIAEDLEKNPEHYPFGPGPIEDLWRREASGELSTELAREMAASAAIVKLIAPRYITAITDHAEAMGRGGAWRQALALHSLTVAAVEALPDDARGQGMRTSSWTTGLEVATRALGNLPDGRILKSAVEAGEKLLALHSAADWQRWLTLHRLGVLYLDPYTAGRSSVNYEQQVRAWRRRLAMEEQAATDDVPEEQLQMPEPPQALETAVSYLRQAAAGAVRDKDKGLSLKALMQALEWAGFLGKKDNSDEIAGLGREALKALDAKGSPREHAALLAIMARHGAPPAAAELDPLLSVPPEQYLERFGPLGASDIYSELLPFLVYEDPPRALGLLRQVRPLWRAADIEQRRIQAMRFEYQLIGPVLAEMAGEPPRQPIPTLAEALRAQARREHWSGERLGAAMAALAAWSGDRDEESAGLEALETVPGLAPGLSADFGEALTYLRGILSVGSGVNGVNAHRYDEAAQEYGHALEAFITLGLKDSAFDALERINDLAGQADAKVATQIVAILAQHGPPLETMLGDPATQLIQKACKLLVRATTAGGKVNPELINLLFRVAKGLRFAVALHRGGRWPHDEQSASLLERIAAAEKEVAASPAAEEADPILDDTLFLAAYVGPGEQQRGDTPRQVLENLQQAYDRRLGERLLAGGAPTLSVFRNGDRLQGLLDERTVLIDYYLGVSPEGAPAVHMVVWTRDTISGAVGHGKGFPEAIIKMSSGHQTILVRELGLIVHGLLEAIGTDPEGGTVSAKAAQLLESEAGNYINALMGFLTDQRKRGRDHLCIVPHGPLHYYPFHLLGKAPRCLADEWIVTYLPNLALLGRPAAGAKADGANGAKTVAAIGLSFTKLNPYGLAEMPEAVEEARAVAGYFGGDAVTLLDAEATEEAVAAAMANARYVHLSTHGKHHFSAPAFQRVYLAPSPGSDGRLCAHEILAHDLDRVELLTLSACETALGRFDLGDNLRGLPASFLLAGVSTVIGTLWDASVDASLTFFKQLYERLHAGDTRLDAFAAAQRRTRKDFPEYRDWGAFYLMGDWS